MKKNLLFFIFSLFVSLTVKGQLLGSIDLDPGKFSKPTICDNEVRKAIDGSVVIIKQSYQVKNKKNGKIFGRNGRKDFGQNYSIGVNTEAGLVFTDEALKPWLDDSAFKKVEDSYEPFISLTEVREIVNDKQTKFTQCPLKMGHQQPNGMWIANADNVAQNAMELDTEEGSKDGWLIWFVAKNNAEKVPDVTITVLPVSKKIDVNGGDITVDAPEEADNVLGAVYVCPSYQGGGHVAYRLVGITVKEEQQLKLRTPFVGFTCEKSSTVQEEQHQDTISQAEEKIQEEQEEIELTPVAQDKKKKKNKK